MRDILDLDNLGLFHLIVECRPPTPAVEFGLGGEEGDVAHHAVVDPLGVVVVVLVYRVRRDRYCCTGVRCRFIG